MLDTLKVMDAQFIEIRHIALPKGGKMEVRLTQVILDRIREQFQIPVSECVNDDYVRMYIWGSVNSAVAQEQAKLEYHRLLRADDLGGQTEQRLLKAFPTCRS